MGLAGDAGYPVAIERETQRLIADDDVQKHSCQHRQQRVRLPDVVSAAGAPRPRQRQ